MEKIDETKTTDITITTINVNGLNDILKRNKTFNWFKLQKSDITLIQETHPTNVTASQWTKEWDGVSLLNSGPTNQSAGVAILISKHIKHEILSTNSDNLGRRISIDIKIQNETYQILNIYAPNKPKTNENFFEETNHYIKNFKNVILAGNFNIVEELRDRKRGNINNTHLIVLKAISKLKNNHNLEHTWRLKHPNTNAFTYHDNYYTRKRRIDRIYKIQNSPIKTTQIILIMTQSK